MGDKLIVEQLVSLNEKQGKLINLGVESRYKLKDICTYKEEQKQGDITYRKKSTKHSRWAISIALLAVYVSIFGADSSFVMWLRSLA